MIDYQNPKLLDYQSPKLLNVVSNLVKYCRMLSVNKIKLLVSQ